jgi:hypothetical protein
MLRAALRARPPRKSLLLPAISVAPTRTHHDCRSKRPPAFLQRAGTRIATSLKASSRSPAMQTSPYSEASSSSQPSQSGLQCRSAVSRIFMFHSGTQGKVLIGTSSQVVRDHLQLSVSPIRRRHNCGAVNRALDQTWSGKWEPHEPAWPARGPGPRWAHFSRAISEKSSGSTDITKEM